jgi:hypothetical protein
MLFDRDGSTRTLREIMGDNRADLRFGTSEDGEIFLTTKRDGYIRRFKASTENGTGVLTNISTRGTVLNGDGLMVGGFVVDDDARRVLIRGLGPTLGDFGVVGALSDVQMTVFKVGGRGIAFNDNWGTQPNADTIATVSVAVGATPLAEGSLDAALLLYLAPGAYTIHLTGVNDEVGVGLIEVYRVP